MLKPLRWPEGWNRTYEDSRLPWPMKPVALERDGIKELTDVLTKIGVDGICTVNAVDEEDPGVALYFTYGSRPYVIASDRFENSAGNMTQLVHVLVTLDDLVNTNEDLFTRALQGFTELQPEKAGIAWPLHWMRIMGSLPDWNRMMPETQRRWIDQRYAEILPTVRTEQAFRDLRQARVEAFADVGAYVMGDKD